MKNVQQLRNELATVITDLRNGTITARDAGAVANLAGKMISSAKAQLDHCALRGDAPNITFLKETKAR
jgi:hypothetical protein